jgi:hypothetical protein
MFLALDRNVVLKKPNAKRILHVLSILNQTDHLIGITSYEAQGIVDFDKFHFLSLFLSFESTKKIRRHNPTIGGS